MAAVAVAETICITEYKKSFKGACVHYGTFEGKIFPCPVKAPERRVTHIRVHTSDGTTHLCAYWYNVDRGNVMDRYMKFLYEICSRKIRLSQQEYTAG